MRNICIVVINLLLAAVITSPLCAQQFEEPPRSDGIGCFEDQPADSFVSAMKPIRQGETVAIALDYKQSVIFASDSAGTALAASEPIQIKVSPSGATYDFDEREGLQRMDITDLLRYGSNDIQLTAANAEQTYWLTTYSPCAKTKKAAQESEAGLLGINNVGDVSRNIFEILTDLQLPESGANQTATSATLAPTEVAARPMATAVPTVEPTPSPTAIATATPKALAIVSSATAPLPTATVAVQSVVPPQYDAVLSAVTELNQTMQRLLHMVQMSLLVAAVLLGALLLGWRHRTSLLALTASMRAGRTIRNLMADGSQHVASIRDVVTAQIAMLVKQLRQVIQRKFE